MIQVPVSPGELLDKLTILAIKRRRINDPVKLANVEREFALLDGVRSAEVPESPELTTLYQQLEDVNQRLWDVEDDLRLLEAEARFDARFIELARSVYVLNDERATVKKAINLLLGSLIVEEKSYADYRAKSA